MKKKSLILLFISFSLLQSCKKETPIDVSSIKIEGVLLNNGKLWSANKETTDGIIKMKQILNTFSDDANLKSYQHLKEKLEIEFTNIFSKCTMKGEAHEQLHNYLKPMIRYFDNLESNNDKVREKSFKKLKYHLFGYVNYFK